MKWEETYRVRSLDEDKNGFVFPGVLLGYLQETAMQQLHVNGPSYESLIESGRAFLISRILVRIYRQPHAYDQLRALTWPCDSRGCSFERCYQLYRGEELIAEATSVWALLNFREKKLCRVAELPFPFASHEPLDLPLSRRLKIPEGLDLAPVGEYVVSYRDADMNRHLNNTRYADILCGFLPQMETTHVKEMEIHYHAEAPLGEKLRVFCGTAEEDGACAAYFRTLRADGNTNVEAKILLA